MLKRPSAGFASLLTTVASGGAVAYATESYLFGSFSFVLLVLTLRHFFFPTRYTVDDRGISVRCLGLETRRPWSSLRRFRYDAAGAFLSTRSRPSVLDSFTGLHLTWSNNKDEVVPAIERYLAAAKPRD